MNLTNNIKIEPIIKSSSDGRAVKILRPQEYELLVQAIPKAEYKTKFDALLFSGMRYSEAKRLYKNQKLFDGNAIRMKSTKKRAKQKERYIHLNREGRTAIRYFLRGNENLPKYSTWVENLERWCKYAGIDPEYMSVKTTRKTWESWLIATMPEKIFQICLSQGHDELTSLRHYANLPFTKDEKEHIKKFTEGWGD